MATKNGNFIGHFPPKGRGPKIELRVEMVDKEMEAAENVLSGTGSVCTNEYLFRI